MPRKPKIVSIEDLISKSIEHVVQRMVASIERQMDRAVAATIAAETKGRGKPRRRRSGASRARAHVEITKWVADRRARRVPNFVIEMTGGLDTKKKIVAKFGADAKFEKGKPLPQAHFKLHDSGIGAASPKAKPPVIRKAAAAS